MREILDELIRQRQAIRRAVNDPDLLDRMQDGLEAVSRDLVSLIRY